mgnify:CR=1 FL=1
MSANLYIYFYYFKYCDDYFSIDDKIIQFFLSSSFFGDKKTITHLDFLKDGRSSDRLPRTTKIHYINNNPPKDPFLFEILCFTVTYKVTVNLNSV